jgi:hypothetical protein
MVATLLAPEISVLSLAPQLRKHIPDIGDPTALSNPGLGHMTMHTCSIAIPIPRRFTFTPLCNHRHSWVKHLPQVSWQTPNKYQLTPSRTRVP